MNFESTGRYLSSRLPRVRKKKAADFYFCFHYLNATFMSGLSSGFAGTLVTLPLDVIGDKTQRFRDKDNPQNTMCLKSIVFLQVLLPGFREAGIGACFWPKNNHTCDYIGPTNQLNALDDLNLALLLLRPKLLGVFWACMAYTERSTCRVKDLQCAGKFCGFGHTQPVALRRCRHNMACFGEMLKEIQTRIRQRNAPTDFAQKVGGRGLRPRQPPWQTCWIFNDLSTTLY